MLAPTISVIRRLLVRIGLYFLPTSSAYAIRLAVFSGRGEPEPLFQRVKDGLGIIKAYDPRRFERIRRYLRLIALVERGGEVYDHALRTYIVDVGILKQRHTEEVAMAIVHEATHARLRHCGIQTTERNHARIEELCVKEEIAFASRLPGGAPFIEHARRKIHTPWWGKEESHRRVDEQLRSLGVPKWVIRVRQRLTARSRAEDKADQDRRP
jgi:hypothetical protein